MDDGGSGTDSANPSGLCHNSSVYLRLSYAVRNSDGRFDDSIKFQCYLIDDGKITENIDEYEVVDLKTTIPKFASPEETWIRTSMAVHGKFLYLAGGSIEFQVEEEVPYKEESQNLVYRIDISQPESGWTRLSSLCRPRNQPALVPSINGNKLYAIGDLDTEKPRVPSHEWVEVFDINRDQWDYCSHNLKALPAFVRWHAPIPGKVDEIYFLGIRVRENNSNPFMLYHCDLVKMECSLYDDTFWSKFVDSFWGEAVMFRERSDLLLTTPALCGDTLYFAGFDYLYCYDLLTKSWVQRPVDGFYFRQILPNDYLRQILPKGYCLRFMTKIVYLGGQVLGTMHIEGETGLVLWVTCKVSVKSDGGRMASDISTIKIFKVFQDKYYPLSVDCFAVPHDYSKPTRKRKALEPLETNETVVEEKEEEQEEEEEE